MEFKKFLQIGVVGFVAAATLANAIAQPVNFLLEAPVLNNSEIVQILKTNISKDDLTHIVKHARAGGSEQAETTYKKINDLITSEYGSKNLDSVKNELNKTLKQMGPDAAKVKVSFNYAMPKEIIDDVVKDNPDVKSNDTSRADNAADVSKECSIQMNLAVDNKGRLFESSELASLSMEEVSAMSNKEIMSVLKETILHEASHCLLHGKMKESDFALKFSDSFAKQNPTIVKTLNAKINGLKTELSSGKLGPVDPLEYLTFINFHENFADINGAFARLGENPNVDTIKEAKEQLINLSRYRESSGLTHQTQYSIQYALTKIEDAAKMSPEQRTDFAKEIASDSLMNNMRLVLKKGVGTVDVDTISTYMVNGLKVDSSNGTIKYEVAEEKLEDFDSITNEINAMREAEPIMGTMSQKLVSHKDLSEQYANQVSSVADNAPKTDNKTEPSLNYAFNLNAFNSIRSKATQQEAAFEPKKKVRI